MHACMPPAPLYTCTCTCAHDPCVLVAMSPAHAATQPFSRTAAMHPCTRDRFASKVRLSGGGQRNWRRDTGAEQAEIFEGQIEVRRRFFTRRSRAWRLVHFVGRRQGGRVHCPNRTKKISCARHGLLFAGHAHVCREKESSSVSVVLADSGESETSGNAKGVRILAFSLKRRLCTQGAVSRDVR